MQMVIVSAQNFESFQLCFEWPRATLNRTGVCTVASEALCSVYSNNRETVGKKESNTEIFHCCYRSGLQPYLELCHEIDSGNEEENSEKRDNLAR